MFVKIKYNIRDNKLNHEFLQTEFSTHIITNNVNVLTQASSYRRVPNAGCGVVVMYLVHQKRFSAGSPRIKHVPRKGVKYIGRPHIITGAY